MTAALAKGYVTLLATLLLLMALMGTSPIGQSIAIMLPDALMYLLVVPILLGAETSGFGTDTATASVFVIMNLVLILSFVFTVTSMTRTIRAISGHQIFTKRTSLIFQLSYPLAVASAFYFFGYMNSDESATFGLFVFTFIFVSLICLPIYIYSKNRINQT